MGFSETKVPAWMILGNRVAHLYGAGQGLDPGI